MVNLIINGKQVQAESSETILDVVRRTGLDDIPTLCHTAGLDPFTSCFLCVAEVKGARGLVPSCATRVRDGMEITTNSDLVNRSRKTNLELLLSNHFADCYPPCRFGCPANVDIQGYIALANRGLFTEAQKLMRETNALPMVCGRVCARPCEDECRRNHVDSPVDIKNIKRYIADKDLAAAKSWTPSVKPATGKKAAIIGAGPAGLACAYFLRQQGHEVAVFERLPEPGGMLRYGIPEYRLPKADLKKEIGIIFSLGVSLKCGVEWGKDFTIDSLFKEGYSSVFLGIGCQGGSMMRVEGEDLPQVLQGVDFLRDVNLGNPARLNGKVFIIGGGNTAIDAARTALRCGADEVSIVYRRTEHEMPANREEIEDAKAEGIIFKLLTAPVSYEGTDGRLTGAKLIRMELGAPDASGRRKPVEVAGSETLEPVDYVIQALGQAVRIADSEGVELNKNKTIKADPATLATSRPGVFAAGDAVTGPDIIIAAIGQGRKAAFAMDLLMRGEKVRPENRLGFHVRRDDFRPITKDDYEETPRTVRNEIAKVPPNERKRSFVEVEQGFSPQSLEAESARCMECGCQDLYECKLRRYSERYGASVTKFKGDFKDDVYESGHRFIEINTAKCVNCGLCERVCREQQKEAVFSFMNRGFETMVVPQKFKELGATNCISCGACVAVCPTGAITEKLPLGKPGPFEHETAASTCGLCGDACATVLESRDGTFMKISSPKPVNAASDLLCFRGRFGYPGYLSASEPESLETHLNRYASEKDVHLSLSPRLTLEELSFAASFAKSKGWSLGSAELAAHADKFSLLAARGLDNVNPAAPAGTVYFLGRFTDEFNSVTFRKFIRNDTRTNLVFHHEPKWKFFRYKTVTETEIAAALRASAKSDTICVVDLRTVPVSLLKSALDWAGPDVKKNIFLLHWTVNLSEAVRLVPASTGSAGRIISVNEDDFPKPEGSANVVRISDRKDITGACDIRHDLLPFLQKHGTVRDQSGNVRKV
jgi:formate dehydrogenase major subunit